MQQLTRAETTLTIIKIAGLVFTLVGVFCVDPTNSTDDFLPYGPGSAATGAAMVFFAVFGYDVMSTAAEEAVGAIIGIHFAFVIVIAFVGVLRVRQPNLPRTCRTPDKLSTQTALNY